MRKQIRRIEYRPQVNKLGRQLSLSVSGSFPFSVIQFGSVQHSLALSWPTLEWVRPLPPQNSF